MCFEFCDTSTPGRTPDERSHRRETIQTIIDAICDVFDMGFGSRIYAIDAPTRGPGSSHVAVLKKDTRKPSKPSDAEATARNLSPRQHCPVCKLSEIRMQGGDPRQKSFESEGSNHFCRDPTVGSRQKNRDLSAEISSAPRRVTSGEVGESRFLVVGEDEGGLDVGHLGP